ncbi:hypothetical protein [Holophaga foetida]|uniref:hypothetical protein n=1 Tax=Holophaga foetida TaxID=35839 RepID=UPI0011DDB495|nr:hypothetical protein [Holophaga foetida]
MTELSHGVSGVAGEYFVCAELSMRGYLATLTLKNAEGIDILATKPNSGKAISIQVKTIQGENRHWVMNEKHEKIQSDDLYYVFVRLKSAGQRPDFHIVPSSIVAAHVAKRHQEWLSEPKRDGSPRKDTSMRGFTDKDNLYAEKWNLIG